MAGTPQSQDPVKTRERLKYIEKSYSGTLVRFGFSVAVQMAAPGMAIRMHLLSSRRHEWPAGTRIVAGYSRTKNSPIDRVTVVQGDTRTEAGTFIIGSTAYPAAKDMQFTIGTPRRDSAIVLPDARTKKGLPPYLSPRVLIIAVPEAQSGLTEDELADLGEPMLDAEAVAKLIKETRALSESVHDSFSRGLLPNP